MRIFAEFFKVYTKRYLTMKSFVLCLLLLPVATMGVILGVAQEDHGGLVVGLVAPPEDGYATAIVAELVLNEDIVFVVVETEETLYEGVANGTYELGYLFEDGFSQGMVALDLKDMIRLVKLEDDIYYQYVNHVVTSAISAEISPLLAQKILVEQNAICDFQELQARIDAYAHQESSFSITVTMVDGEQEIQISTLVPNLIRGIICLFLFISCCVVVGMQFDNHQVRMFVPHLSPVRTLAYEMLPMYVLSFVAVVVTLGLSYWFYGREIAVIYNLGIVVLYQISLFLLTLALRWLVSGETLMVFVPFLVLGILLSHPIFFDMTVLFPQCAGWLKLLPTYQYLAWDTTMLPYWIGTNLLFGGVICILGRREIR